MAELMECLQIESWGGDLERTTVPVPEPGPGEVLVEVEATSVGLTVRNSINGDLGDDPANLPRIPGHEIVGRVAETGVGVDGLEPGDHVGAYFYLNCGRCSACRSGHEPLCEDLGGYVGIDLDGGFAEFAVLPAGNALELPDDLDPVDATVVPDALATPYHVANQRAKVEPGDDVLILGAGGGVGIHLVQMVQHFGGRAHAVDRVPEKLDVCRELGATSTVDTSETSLDTVDTTFDAVVDFTGATSLLETATSMLAPRGRLVNLTTFPGRSIDVSPREQVLGEVEVVGSRYCSKYEYLRCGDLVADGEIEPIVTEVVELADVPELLERIADGEVTGRGAVVL